MVRIHGPSLGLAALALVSTSSRCRAESTATSSASGACPTVLVPSYQAPVVAGGYVAQLIATGLKRPRGILIDSNGALLVVQQGSGIVHLKLSDHGGTCVSVQKSTTLVNDSSLNHGIELSKDGKTLYASSDDKVFSWAYDSAAVSVSGKRTLIQNMTNSDHVSRTLLLSRKAPDLLLVSRGSSENVDAGAAVLANGRSVIRAFNISNVTDTPYDFPSQGKLLGWGLRNSVGVAEEPQTGGIFSVENSADQMRRDGEDIHENNPGEEMNFHGFLNGSTEHQGGNYGYPHCFALWDKNIPNAGNLTVGNQFAPDPDYSESQDRSCLNDYVPPRLTFQAHMAPLDIKFTPDGSLAYITFHGSWNRDKPAGYKLSTVAFADGQPVDAPDSTTAVSDVLSNADTSACPGKCFRPVGLAIDTAVGGRVFMTSDSTGEIYAIQRAEVSATGSGGGGSKSSSGGGTLVTSTTTGTHNAAPALRTGRTDGWLFAALTVGLMVVGGWVFAAAF
ncbi:hypothetical protein VTK73DRAFT_624 [Phialemonium thermophilum]|uniref:Pyrroloquinoline quinone-dependent pyranose dehydrogenase beta-propeller domain-containing protein n=1 Tax=Phialemonium thermophilum TaxID=223376 RepID=A0ABR3VUK0_9PEZI